MAKKKVSNDYPFYQALRDFYVTDEPKIRRHFKDASKKILDFNDKRKNPNAFLREPQFEALEMYVFIKEYLSNQKVKDIFADWYHSKDRFESRSPFISYNENGERQYQGSLVDDITANVYNDVFDSLQNQDHSYPNYIYALTMGTGKTILMATCIFYDFILASKNPKDNRFCHNALVFAPDKTVLQSLKEIKTFDLNKVIPAEYCSFLISNIKFHFLDDASTTLNTIDGSDYNIIISNTQKIILKEVHKERTAVDKLMNDQISLGFDEGLDDFTKNLYSGLDELKDDKEVTANQRFEKIIRLSQLGIFVDEAHHLFGADLKSSLSDDSKETSLRYTINKIAQVLEKKATKMVACYNYTGTPYVDNHVLPEVVYSYGLKKAIDSGYLKQVEIAGFDNVKNIEFLRKTLEEFFIFHGDALYEGLKPKIAIFGAEIKEVTDEIKPAVEGILNDLGIDTSTVLVNVGDSTVTNDTDIQDFNNLDVVGTEGSKKQVLLLVNKGREGWNCRSLFSVALFRSPKSKIFVLQSTMRCLRSITEMQQLAHVYLSNENYEILNDELKKNFNVDISTVSGMNATDKTDYAIKIVPPIKELCLEEIKRSYSLIDKGNENSKFTFDISKIDLDKYKSIKRVKKGLDDRFQEIDSEFVSEENRPYSIYSMIFEISRYLNIEPLKIEKLLLSTDNLEDIVKTISTYNEILYSELIPSIFSFLYSLKEVTETKSKIVPLIKYPKDCDHFVFRSTKNLTIERNDPLVRTYNSKSFHTDRYCFDSEPEKQLFMRLLEADSIKEVYFTGMFTGSENGLSVQYIDPESNLIRNYYPDILVYYKDGSIEIIEVKGDNKIDDKVVEAKAYAALELADHSKMSYDMVKSSEIMKGEYKIKDSANN
jgi:hypothetical protein